MRRTDRGVFSVAAKQEIDRGGDNISVITGNVISARKKGAKVVVKVQRLDRHGQYKTYSYEYDRVIIAIGFDPLTAFELFPDHLTSKEKLTTIGEYIDKHLRIPDLKKDCFEHADYINVHLPMLSGFAQGPGFPNLSCLGALSDRILSAYIDPAVVTS